MVLIFSNFSIFLSGVHIRIVIKIIVKVGVSEYLSIEVVIIVQVFMRMVSVFAIIREGYSIDYNCKLRFSLLSFSRIYKYTH